MKAYGFPTRQIFDTGHSDVAGSVFAENGTFLGSWISSDMRFLENDLKNHCVGYDYEFVQTPPQFLVDLINKGYEL